MVFRLPAIVLVILVSVSCTSGRWVVADENVIDSNNEPNILGEQSILLLENEPSVENPVIGFSAYRILEKEYQQRVKVERTIQRYRPKWGFLIAGLTGAAFAALAANSNLILPSVSSNQKLALNITSGVLAVLSVSNMKPVGEPIYTGETELMRRSGTQVVYDTLRSEASNFDYTVDLNMFFREDTVLSQPDLSLSEGRLDVNLVSVIDHLDDVDEHSSVRITLAYNGESDSYEIPVTSFLAPYVTIHSPVAVLRNAPVINELNVVTEVGTGSALELLGNDHDDWYRVRFGGSEVYLSKDDGQIEWMSEASPEGPDVFEFSETPFGEIDVENSVPILKQNNPGDRAVILTNGYTGQSELRQYLDRDHRLFRFYMRHALQMEEEQIYTIEMDSTGGWQSELRNVAETDTTGSLFVYLSGFAAIADYQTLYLDRTEEPEGAGMLASFVFEEFERIGPSSLFLFIDLEFREVQNGDGLQPVRGAYNQTLQHTANQLLRRIPNSVVVFSHRPDQQSGLYTGGAGMENKRHHIFTYYLAEAVKQRKTQMSDIIRHLENNVDYTSRRLHDRPQEIQAYGNFTLRITD